MSKTKIHALQALLEQAAGADAELRTMKKQHKALHRALIRIARIVQSATSLDPAHRKGGRRKNIAAGSLEHRLVQAAAEPVTLAQLVEASNARPADAKSAVVQLRKDGRLKRVGAGRNSKYQAAA